MRKLVRDKIPRLMLEDDVDPHVRILVGPKLDWALRGKLAEEAMEVTTATSRDDLLEELADTWEVLYALVKHHGWLMRDVYEAARDKGIDKGRFTQGFEVEVPE